MIYILCRRGREGERKRRRRKSSGSRLLFVHRPGTFFTWFYRLYGTYREMRSRRGFVLQCAALWFLIDLLTQEHRVTLKRGGNFLKEKFPWRGNIGLDIPVSTDKLHQDIYKKKKKKNRGKLRNPSNDVVELDARNFEIHCSCFFFFFFETILFNLQKKKEKWRETKYSMKVTKRKMYMYITMKCKWIK